MITTVKLGKTVGRNITLRRASPTDTEILGKLNAHVQSLHHQQLPWLFKPPSEQSARAFFETLFEDQANTITLALCDEEPAGYIYFEARTKPETAFSYAVSSILIHHLSVDPRYRKMGIGRALVESVDVVARDLGMTIVQLDFWTSNQDARRFYERLGYERTKECWWKAPMTISSNR